MLALRFKRFFLFFMALAVGSQGIKAPGEHGVSGDKDAAASTGSFADWFRPSTYSHVVTTKAVGDASSRIADAAEQVATDLSPVLQRAALAITPLQQSVDRASSDVRRLTGDLAPVLHNVGGLLAPATKPSQPIGGAGGSSLDLPIGGGPASVLAGRQPLLLGDLTGDATSPLADVPVSVLAAQVHGVATAQRGALDALASQKINEVNGIATEKLRALDEIAQQRIAQVDALAQARVGQVQQALEPVMEVIPRIQGTLDIVNAQLAQAQKHDGQLMCLDSITGKEEHDHVPVTNLAAGLNGVLEHHQAKLDSVLRSYVKKAGIAVGVSVAVVLVYKIYAAWRDARAADFKALEACCSLVEVGSKQHDAQSAAVLKAAQQRIKATKTQHLVVCGGAVEDVVQHVFGASTFACIPGHVVCKAYQDPTLQKTLLAAMQAARSRKIPVVMMQAESLLADVGACAWVAAAFQHNRIILATQGQVNDGLKVEALDEAHNA